MKLLRRRLSCSVYYWSRVKMLLQNSKGSLNTVPRTKYRYKKCIISCYYNEINQASDKQNEDLHVVVQIVFANILSRFVALVRKTFVYYALRPVELWNFKKDFFLLITPPFPPPRTITFSKLTTTPTPDTPRERKTAFLTCN